MCDLGQLSYFIGIIVTRIPSYMLLSQQKYALEILECAGTASCKLATTHMHTKAKLSADSRPQFYISTLYNDLASALQFFTFTHPDIAYAVQHVFLFMHDPGVGSLM